MCSRWIRKGFEKERKKDFNEKIIRRDLYTNSKGYKTKTVQERFQKNLKREFRQS